MAQTITIEVGDDGRIVVTAEENGQPAGEPYECDSPQECLQFVESIMAEDMGESPEEQTTESPENYEAMWNEEAGKRPANPNMMR